MRERAQYLYQYESPLGSLTAVSDGTAITRMTFSAAKEGTLSGKAAVWDAELPVFGQLESWLDTFFTGEDPGAAPPIKFIGTSFRQSVWQIVSEVPYGVLITYGEIARRLAQQRGIPKMAAQAVGGAVGCNPISLLIPCHRVIGTDGRLVGYGGCLDLKIKLLAYEGIVRNWQI